MKIFISNNIVIESPTPKILHYIKKTLIVDNPVWHKNKRLGYGTYNIPRDLHFYKRDGEKYIIPFGCMNDLWKLHPVKKDFEASFEPLRACSYKSSIIPYPYQEKAIKSILRHRNGIVVMPAGSGKTQTAMESICRMGVKTLWITHTLDLLNQSKKRAKDNIDDIDIGVIASGKVHIGNHITFATVQTLSKLNILTHQSTWDMVVVDECHRICGTPASAGMFYDIIDNLSARYKIGLTATPYRAAKGTEVAMFSLLGPTIIEIDESVAKKMKAEIQPLYSDFEIDESCIKTDGTIDYMSLVESMIIDKNRNDIIIECLKAQKNHYVLILSDRLQHLEYLMNQCPVGEASMISGNSSKKAKDQRKKALIDIASGKIKYLFATYNLAKEGLDIPNLDRLIFATPKKDKATIVQSVGRIERIVDKKKTPVVYDIVDSSGYHKRLFTERKRYYKQNGNTIREEI